MHNHISASTEKEIVIQQTMKNAMVNYFYQHVV